MTLKVMVNDTHFQYLLRESHDACFMQIWWFQLKSVMSYCADTPNFLEVNMVKMTLKVEVNDPCSPSSIPAESIPVPWCMFGANLVIQLKSVTSYNTGRVKFTNRQTDRHRRQYPFCLKGQRVIIQNMNNKSAIATRHCTSLVCPEYPMPWN